MSDSEIEAEETGGLLFSDLNSSSSGLAPDCSPLKLDHCDLLLDAMDKQLGQLQVLSRKSQTRFKEKDGKESVTFGWSRCMSKDTGLGSTNDTPLSCQDLIHTPVDNMSETGADFPIVSEYSKHLLCKRDKAVLESHQEQVMWRLQRLLGNSSEDQNMAPQTLSDSICTEDFARRFTEEMVDDVTEAKERIQLKKQNGGASTETVKSSGEAFATKSSLLNEKRGAELRWGSTQKDKDNNHVPPKAKTIPQQKTVPQMSTSTPKAKCLAGVPMLSFDTVSIDSDLDSVCTERLRHHIHKQPGWRSFIKSVRNLDEVWSNHRDEDTLDQSEPHSECLPVNEEKLNNAQHPSIESTRHEFLQKPKESYLPEVRSTDVCKEPRRSLRASEKRSDVVMMSVLERDEMERQLASAKSELFAEQRRAREKLESMQERFEEAHEELQKATDSEISLRNKCVSVEEKHRETTQQLQVLKSQVCDLQGALQGCQLTVQTLEKILSQKELQLLELNNLHVVVQTDRDELEGKLQHLKTQHYTALREAREQAHTTLVTALEQQKKDLVQLHNRELQELKEEEAKKYKEELEMEVLKKVDNTEITCVSNVLTSDQVQAAVEQERGRSEAENEERSRLEEQLREREEHMNSIIQHEKKKVHTLHSKLVHIQTEKQKAAVELERAQKETDRLRRTLEERERLHSETTAEAELRVRESTRDIQREVQQLKMIVEHNKDSPEHKSWTAVESLTVLRSAREQIQSFISCLKEELQSHKHTTEQLHKDKERELSIQRQQLRMERDHALDSLKERLIQEHIEELSSIPMSEGAAADGVVSCLRRQLKAKDLELRQVQKSMAQWKELTAQRMAWKYEEELTAELERCKAKLLKDRNILKTQQQKNLQLSKEDLAQTEKAAPLSAAVDTSAGCNPSDTASLKLLRYLQSRVKQLRTEQHIHSPSPSTPPT